VFLAAYATSTRELMRTLSRNWRLLLALSKRELTDDYIGHGLSVSWAIINPLVSMAIYLFLFTLVFPTRIVAPPGEKSDAIVYLLAGMIPWLTLAQAMGRSGASILNNASIVKQMTFPLELLPIKALAAPLLFGAVSLVFLACYGLWISGASMLPAYALGLPVLIVLTVAFLAGVSLVLACTQVFVRDLREIVNIFLSIGLFTHPILYLPNAVPAVVRPVIYLSPLSYLLFCWQDIMFYGAIERPWAWFVASAFSLALLGLGARLFIVSKAHFGDFL
jgi:lipopolysaccharide transport system permease protein